MIISVINHTGGELSDAEVQQAIRAINRQISEDFEPYWSMNAKLRLEGREITSPDDQKLAEMRGDAVIYLWNDLDVAGALGYHDMNNRGIPFGFVFVKLVEQLGESWTTTLSHEAIEVLADPEVNLLVVGPHPEDPTRDVFHWYEMCDAVQTETYSIDGIEVSNFLLPLYFTGGEEKYSRNDFLGTRTDGSTLKSFGVNPGGYIGFYDPTIGKHDTFTLRGDKKAMKRMKTKGKAETARRAIRYQTIGVNTKSK